MTRRDFKEEVNDKYMLPRNEAERERLQNQHELITEVFDDRLIIDQSLELKPGHRVLDSGTGAASWILELLNMAPHGVEIVGVDISAAMFPTNIPKTVSLYEMSFMDLPQTWDSSFDFVNQRLLIAALTQEQWKTAISELFRVLKPGGSIQITEVGHFGFEGEATELSATKQCDAYCNAIFDKRNLLGFDCWVQLPVIMKDVGFVEIRIEVKKVPLGKQWGKLGITGSQNWDGVYRALGSACLVEGGLDVCNSQAEVESVVEQAKKEWDENPGVFIDAYTLIARKHL